MKNELYYNSEQELLLLSNEEDELNSIWLSIVTDDTPDQSIEINVQGGVHTTIALDSGAVNEFELENNMWAVGGFTLFRLLKDGFEGTWQSIEFPEMLTTDATLYEVQPDKFKLNGQTNETAESAKTKIIRYTNARPYSLGSTLTKIATISFTCGTESTAAYFSATVNFDVSNVVDTADVTIRLVKNLTYDEYFIPQQIVKDGKHTITITYPMTDIAPNSANEVSMYMNISSGQADIDQQQILASLIASGIVTEPEWDGYINIEEAFGIIPLNNGVDVYAVEEEIETETQIPIPIDLAETLGIIPLNNGISIYNINENVLVNKTSLYFDGLLWSDVYAETWGAIYDAHTW